LFEPLLTDETDLRAEVALVTVSYRFDGVVQVSIEIDCGPTFLSWLLFVGALLFHAASVANIFRAALQAVSSVTAVYRPTVAKDFQPKYLCTSATDAPDFNMLNAPVCFAQ